MLFRVASISFVISRLQEPNSPHLSKNTMRCRKKSSSFFTLVFIAIITSPRECCAHNDKIQQQNKHEREKYFDGKSCTKKDGCKGKCTWGYEAGCQEGERYSKPICHEVEGYRSFRNLRERADAFWNENDFGYLRNVGKLNLICEPNDNTDSSFECNDALTFCRGSNIFMHLTFEEGSGRSVFQPGQFGGHCKLSHDSFKNNNMYRNKLMSWAANDLDKFESLPFKPSDSSNCDVVVATPTIVMDLDFIGNLYHHFCDFFNLYLTLHANDSLHTAFDVAKWNAFEALGPFGDTWKAFTNNVYPLWSRYRYKKVCFKDVVFSLLPRMAYGMYYSTPLVEGCSRSGMFKAFSEHVLNGLDIKQNRKSRSDAVRVTLLYRTTKYRRIVNQDEIIALMKSIPGLTVRVVDFNMNMPFIEQVKISSNSDIFIGIHGAGLTHTLFLPDWAVLFELYNAEDVNCYKDLARLRGVTYLTWQNKEKLKDETDEPHPQYSYEKFKNYRFDVDEFKKLLQIAIEHVKENLADLL